MGLLTPAILEDLDVSRAVCAPACALFDPLDVLVVAVARGPFSITLMIGTVPSLVGCPSCGVFATGHGRVPVLLHALPRAGVPVRVARRKRRYRCCEDDCEATTRSEAHELPDPRAELTGRAFPGGGCWTW